MVFGKPTFVLVQDFEMGFEKIVKIAHSSRVCKQQKIQEKLKAERRQLAQGMGQYLKVIKSILGIDNHDANASFQLDKFSGNRREMLRGLSEKEEDERHASRREDGWMEIEIGEFYCGEEDQQVKMSVRDVGYKLKAGLIVEGIHVRPKLFVF